LIFEGGSGFGYETNLVTNVRSISRSVTLQAADKVRLSISALDVSFLTAGVASKRGFFKNEGLDVEVIRMNANVSIPALSTGDIDYTMVFASVIRGALRGLPMKVVASFMDSSTHMLIARPEHKAIKDLKGKILGVSTFGATADVAARMMIRHSGIDPEREIKIIVLGPDRARFAALREGIVDVIVISPPADSEAKKLGFNVLARTYELFTFPFTGIGSTTKKLREKPDEVKRMIKAGIRANRYVRQNRDGDSGHDGMGEDGPRGRRQHLRIHLAHLQRRWRHDGEWSKNGHRPGEAVHEY